MTAELETLVVAAYYFASLLPVPARRGPRAKISDAELVALAVCQAAMGICSDRQFLGLVRFRLRGWFPHLPDQTQYNRRLRGLTAQMVWVQQRLSELCASGPLRVADGTLVGAANYAGCAAKSEFAGFAAYGYCASKSRWYWGVRLVLLVDRKGLPVGYTLVPANEREYEPVRELALGDGSEILVADKGLWGKQYAHTLELEGVLLHTPDRVRSADNLERERSLASVRLVVESTIANLKCQMRLEDHLAKTPAGLIQRIAQRLLALTIGVLLNTQNGRPPRNLVAYDGR
jgi:Transposase DDE domain